jgi:hypothetical protein
MADDRSLLAPAMPKREERPSIQQLRFFCLAVGLAGQTHEDAREEPRLGGEAGDGAIDLARGGVHPAADQVSRWCKPPIRGNASTSAASSSPH